MKSVGCIAKKKWTRSTLMITLLRKGCVGLIALGSALNGSVGGQVRTWPPTLSARPAVTVTADGLLVDWRAPEASIVSHDDGTIGVLLPGYSQTTQPGAPLLPFISVLVAVPPGAIPTLRVVLAEETDIPLHGALALAPFPEGVQRDESGHPIGGDFSAGAKSLGDSSPGDASFDDASSAASVQLARSSDGEPVTLEPAGVARGVRLARLVFYPARPIGDYPQARLRVTTHVRISLTFAGQIASQPGAISPDPLLAELRSEVINPEQVRPLPFTIQNPPAERKVSPPFQSEDQYLVESDYASAWIVNVLTPGLTAITYEALAGNGFPVASTDPRNLHLARSGTEIAAEWEGDEDASFEPGERLLFYAVPRFSRWTPTDVYFLWQDVTPGLRVPNRPAAPTGQPVGVAWADETAEVNQLYTPDCFCGSIPPGRDGDQWTWDDFKQPGHPTA